MIGATPFLADGRITLPAIEFIFEILLSAVWEGLFQFGGELVIEVAGRVFGAPFERRDRAHPILAGIGVVLLGGLVGLLVSLVFPERLITVGRVPGASLVLSPLFNALAMEYYGRWRESRGRSRSYLATFWGGGLFALGMASVRFFMTRGDG
jgi:hypothetical protein